MALVIHPGIVKEMIKNFKTIRGLEQPTEFKLYDLIGREVLRTTATDEQRISIEHLNSGIYSYTIGQQTGKLFVE